MVVRFIYALANIVNDENDEFPHLYSIVFLPQRFGGLGFLRHKGPFGAVDNLCGIHCSFKFFEQNKQYFSEPFLQSMLRYLTLKRPNYFIDDYPKTEEMDLVINHFFGGVLQTLNPLQLDETRSLDLKSVRDYFHEDMHTSTLNALNQNSELDRAAWWASASFEGS